MKLNLKFSYTKSWHQFFIVKSKSQAAMTASLKIWYGNLFSEVKIRSCNFSRFFVVWQCHRKSYLVLQKKKNDSIQPWREKETPENPKYRANRLYQESKLCQRDQEKWEFSQWNPPTISVSVFHSIVVCRSNPRMIKISQSLNPPTSYTLTVVFSLHRNLSRWLCIAGGWRLLGARIRWEFSTARPNESMGLSTLKPVAFSIPNEKWKVNSK